MPLSTDMQAILMMRAMIGQNRQSEAPFVHLIKSFEMNNVVNLDLVDQILPNQCIAMFLNPQLRFISAFA